jgi:cbb3-type cytochrome oxidase maturation protein
MDVLYLLLPLSLVLVVLIGVAFWWAVTTGQFEHSDEAARSILRDDDATAADTQSSVVLQCNSGAGSIKN